MGVFSLAFLVFLMKESKKNRRKQPGKLMAKFRSQPVNLPGARPLMNPLPLSYRMKLVCSSNGNLFPSLETSLQPELNPPLPKDLFFVIHAKTKYQE